MRYHLIIFDVDGTLMDSTEHNRSMLLQILRRQGVPVTAEDVDRVRGRTLRECYQVLAPGIDPDACIAAHRDVETRNMRIIRPFGDVFPTFRILRDRPVACATQTSRGRHTLNLLYASYGLDQFFDAAHILAYEDVTRHKPHPEGIERLMAMLDGDPSRTLYVGDTEHDIRAAKAAGVRSALIHRDGAVPLELLAESPDHIFSSLTQLLPLCE